MTRFHLTLTRANWLIVAPPFKVSCCWPIWRDSATRFPTLSAKFVFERDERKSVVIHSVIDTEVKMVCQRCLELVTLPIHSECSYAVVKEGANTQSLPKGYDVLELGEDPLDLHALIEEELLLALPIVPAHHPEECQQPAGADEPEPSEDEVTRSNPFSVLAQLKRDPNV